jgi:hypothetical protein
MTKQKSIQLTHKWQMTLVYFGLVSLGLSQPIFNNIELFRREFQMNAMDVVAIVIIFQYAITGFLLLIRKILNRIFLQQGFDFLIVIGAVISFIRQVQLHHLKTEGMPSNDKIFLVVGLLVIAIIAVVLFRRFLILAAEYAGWISPIFGIVFVYNLMNHPLPLNRGGDEDMPTTDKPAVLLVIMDEFALSMILNKAGQINANRFPNFSKMKSQSIWYKNAITNYPTSSFSFPSFLTSKINFNYNLSMVNDLETLPPNNIFKVLNQNGYSIKIYTDYFGCAGRTFFCDSYLNGSDPQFFLKTFFKFVEEFGPDFLVDRIFPSIHGAQLKHQTQELLEAARNLKPGNFHMLHMMTSHAPYVLSPDGRNRHSKNLRMAPGVDFNLALENYESQLLYLDSVIGDFLDIYEARSPDLPLIAMFVSDHGNCWTNACPGRVQPAKIKTVMPSLTGIPAFLMVPGQTPRTDNHDFQLIDLSPTLLNALNIDTSLLGADIDGVARLNSPPKERSRAFFLSIDTKPLHIPIPNRAVEVE